MKKLYFLCKPKFWGAFFLCCALFLSFTINADATSFNIGIEWDTLTEVDFASVDVIDLGSDLQFDVTLNTSILGPDADLQYFFFNLADGLTNLSVTGADVDGFTFEYSNLNTNPKLGFHAGGDGYYDVVVDFGSGANPTIQDTSFNVSSTSRALDIADILFGSEGGPKGSYYMGIHAQTTTWEEPDGTIRGSEWAGAPIPEPATMLLVGSGLIGLVGLGRKRFLKNKR